ncbi:16S rRNA (cytosine(1407)-C(5))-methyltransferase RsmF [Shewanella cyperi]|uniref:16S rRNA (cytosine(1407)-C(5))-methyltransferase RsmF n=1 Tax=Shewanella cyperi TaxID=2814292 RepID=UPI001A93FDFA|nr:16S rRNA (cytosine(1407)-C(5))-methyltransferase RsmF [Shewanella cyperi]QSX39363.1 16S rRNA (cytosine(1407)-C(5))-methyltransferase RsmF [Shewanella cyperi]
MVQLNQKFINSIAKDLPAHLSLDDFIHYCGLPLRPAIRVNTLKTDATKLKALLEPKGWQFEPIPWCRDGFWVQYPQECQPGNLSAHLQGLFYIQEASSMLPPTALFKDNEPNTVLDVASAPGSKTTQMAALMANRGLLVANEYSSSRVKVLHANLLRMGVYNCALTHFDGRVFGEYLYETFDAVLLDAPCGGEGTVRKDADALKHWDESEIGAIADTQKALINSAFLALKPGGVLVYSTCTLNRRENQEVCLHLKQKYGDAVEFESLENLFDGAHKALTSEGFLHIWPQIYDSEGFFVARLRKTASVPREHPEPRLQKQFPFQKASNKDALRLQQAFADLGLNWPAEGQLMARDDEFWWFPDGFEALQGKMRFQRIGIKLADDAKHGLKIRHEAVIAFGTQNKALVLDEEQACQYLMGRDIALDVPAKASGEKLVWCQGAPLGVVKHLGNRLKNGLPRDLVRDKVQS